MKQKILLLILFLIFHNITSAQTADSLYNLTAYGNFGFDGLNRNGIIGNLKVMWKPDYLLRAGLEVSMTDVYSVDESSVPTDSGVTSLQTDVYAWTFMGVFSMSPVKNLELNVATGLAFTTVNNSAFETESSSTDFGSVFMISAGYFFPVSKDFNIGAELRAMKIAKYNDYTLAMQVSFMCKFLEW